MTMTSSQEINGYIEPECSFSCYALGRTQSVSRLAADDPRIDYFHFSLDTVDRTEADVVGHAISKSTHLRKLIIETDYYHPTASHHASLFAWVGHNRSIEHLTLRKFDHSHGNIFQHLAPFFVHNLKLRCIEITNSRNLAYIIPSLISALSQFSQNIRLERIDLRFNSIVDEKMEEFIYALNTMSGIHNLLELVLSGNKIGEGGCTALGVLLKNTACKLSRLYLGGNDFDDVCMGILTDAMAVSKTLQVLVLGSLGDVTSLGWHKLSAFISDTGCSIKCLMLGGNHIDDEGATFLGESLVVNTTLKKIDLTETHITPTGWQQISKCLSDPTSLLLDIDISECDMNDEGAVAFFSALAKNRSVRVLCMQGNESITSTGWVSCFELLVNSPGITGLPLENLDLYRNNIDNDGAAMLAVLLTRHVSTLNTLCVVNNEGITTNGWRSLAMILLPTSASKLRDMSMGNESREDDLPEQMFVSDAVICDTVEALRNNTILEHLDLNVCCVSELSMIALANVLCDISSIAGVCQSNHTIFKHSLDSMVIGCPSDDSDFDNMWGDRFPSLYALLEINKNKNKAEVIREKLLLYFFSNVDTVGRTFSSLPVSIMPSAISYIGRDHIGYSVMYYLVRSMPSLVLGAHVSEVVERPKKLPRMYDFIIDYLAPNAGGRNQSD